MSTGKLSRVSDVMNEQVEAGEISGAVTAIALRGEVVHLDAHGWKDIDDRIEMPLDAIFRMASSTKPVVGVAVMQLLEQGLVDPDDPVRRYLPTFHATKVAVKRRGRSSTTATTPADVAPPASAGPAEGMLTGPGPARPPVDPSEVELVPAHREVLVRDLLTHTSGLMSGGLGSAITDVRRTRDDTLATYIPRLGDVPLDFQPGSRWAYSPGTGIDVLGHIVEIVSGKPLDAYLRDHIFDPLDMRDTTFALSDDQRPRLLPLYRRTDDGQLVKADTSMANRMSSPTYFSGSGGLFGTAADYLNFESMLTNGGTFAGRQVLRPETVRLMATNHVGDLFRGIRDPIEGVGFGYTVQVMLDAAKAGSPRSNGAFGWGGAFGTMSWSDPARGLSGALMVQQPNLVVRGRFERAVRTAIDEIVGSGQRS